MADNEFLKVDGTKIEGRSASDVKTDLSLNNVENTALSTWGGSSNITTVGSITAGEWAGTAIDDAYIASAGSWNGKQDAITSSNRLNANVVSNGSVSNTEFDYLDGVTSAIQTQLNGKQDSLSFGISTDNVLQSNGTMSDDQFLKVDGTKIEGRSASDVRSDIDAQETIDASNRLSATLVGANGNVSNTEYGYLDGVTSAIQTQLDNRYTESEMEDIIEHSYISKETASDLAVGWYTIATNTGNRAVARFGVWDTDSSRHQSVIFYAAHKYGNASADTITVLDTSHFSISPFRYIRIKAGGTYDGAALQVYIDSTKNALNAAILGDNFQTDSWVLCDFIPDADTPPLVSNYGSFSESSRIDLDEIAQGGFATTGPIYADGNTSQYKVLTTNDGGISSDNVLRSNGTMSDNEFLKVDGTKIEGRSTSEVKTDLGLSSSSTVQFGSLGVGGAGYNTLDVNGGVAIGASYISSSAPSNGLLVQGNVGIGTNYPSYALHVNGSIVGSYKSFLIDHPSKEGKKLMHGCIEGPELAVYFRGKSDLNLIKTPDYWEGLVDIDSMTVELTAIGPNQNLYVSSIAENGDITIGSNTDEPMNYFYAVYGERKDVKKLDVEIDIEEEEPVTVDGTQPEAISNEGEVSEEEDSPQE